MSQWKKFILYGLKFAAVVMAAGLPFITFMRVVMDIDLLQDYGFWITIGFAFCVAFYAEIIRRLLPKWED